MEALAVGQRMDEGRAVMLAAEWEPGGVCAPITALVSIPVCVERCGVGAEEP